MPTVSQEANLSVQREAVVAALRSPGLIRLVKLLQGYGFRSAPRSREPMRVLLIVFVAAALLPAQVVRNEPIPPRPPVTVEEIAGGKTLFQGHCGGCHGPEGRGERGPNLARPNLSHVQDAQSLFLVINLGIEGTEMPRGWQLHDREIWKIAAYVESLGRTEPEPLPGDPGRGKDLYYGKGDCASCHWLGGQGGRQGPELTEIGASRSLAYLRQSLLDPAAAVPEGFLLVATVGRDGRRIRGVRLNEDPFTIQIRDSAEAVHSLRKEDLAELHKQKGESSMPPYGGTFTATEIDDLVSFLASQRGRP